MKKIALVSTLALILTACGGGSDSSSDNGNNGNGGDNGNGGAVTAPTAVKGAIESISENKKTIVVNGYSYDVAGVSYGDVELDSNALQPNMMVQIGSAQKAAVQVQLEPTITGKVTKIDRNADTFDINGMTLSYKLSDEINQCDWVMVSSLPTANAGYKVLSVVKFENDELVNHYEVEGPISSINATNETFKLGAGITVVYTGAKIEAPMNGLEKGQWVEVEGSLGNGQFNATSVEVEDYNDLANDTEVEGIVTWVNPEQTAFELNYQGRFVVNAQTKFEEGIKSDLKQGALVEVTSVKQGTKQVATEVEFDDDNSTGDDNDNAGNWEEFEQEGQSSLFDFNSQSFVINGVQVFVDAQTAFEDGIERDTIHLKHIEVEGVVINGQNIAREIEADND
ncbi:DUF5666 domain-containing protein [Shewanella sp. 1CM18E]|uniref:DUF5666 domain-containing protein n=1 Tax=Shewanella sp. 1CM18E TaxID=2929169 RepID=UPI0020C1536B|nr:DUF5666 domain-containing protein [Shewanella sp. 1CM18E]MCK8046180.1 DUF5666 domain-containing protein [Shewanella sp. 1CM18E]